MDELLFLIKTIQERISCIIKFEQGRTHLKQLGFIINKKDNVYSTNVVQFLENNMNLDLDYNIITIKMDMLDKLYSYFLKKEILECDELDEDKLKLIFLLI